MGIESTRAGKRFEAAFDESALRYRQTQRAIIERNYPKSEHLGTQVIFTGQALPDYTVLIPRGRVAYIEVKATKRKMEFRYHLITGSISNPSTTRLNQFEKLNEFGATPYCIPSFYLVAWYGDTETEWRMYDATCRRDLPLHPTPKFGPDTAIAFYRAVGVLVPSPNDWPDWLEVVENATETP